VTTTHFNALELISLQNQLLMTIGGSQSARAVMHRFMQTAMLKLGLSSIHLYFIDKSQDDEETLSHYLSIPDNKIDLSDIPVIRTMLQRFIGAEIKTPLSENSDGKELMALAFGATGVLLFENKAGVFQQPLKDILVPVILRLAEYYQLCVQQKHLNEEVKVNKQAQQNYELLAKQDPLTNLPNRREFRYSLSREISNSQRYGYFSALIYIDLDNFKNVNDSLGHSIGDILLTQVAKRLSLQARSGDTVFRIGGDEFVYILSNIGETEADAIRTAQSIAIRIIEILEKPVEIGEFSLHVTPSIGITIFPDEYDADGNDSEHVLRHADTAMYRAKQQGRNCYAFFNPEMHVEASRRLIIEDHLRKAITNNELSIEYQPIVDSQGNIIGAESLVRWNNPTLGRVSPDNFIGIAEESNLILTLSNWITEHVCRYAEFLYEQLPEASAFSYISINISPRQFIQSDFVESMSAIIDSCTVPNQFIKLEFTENVLVDNLDSIIVKMEKLQKNNIDFLLDDFGTGYSSLSYLHKLPIWLLKIDKSFITDFHLHYQDKQAIVNAILAITQQLDIKCIVEGVELQEHADYFKEKGVYGMQGFFYHKPMSGDALLDLLCAQ
jgi:diguanylate cyclase (GGDEF)-like protein